MERIISEDERIKRAEYVSEMRRNRIPAGNINIEPKRKISRLTKTFIQVITSMALFGIIYFIDQTNSYAFDSIKPIVSNDMNIPQIYSNIDGIIKDISKSLQDDSNNSTSIIENIKNKINKDGNNNDIENHNVIENGKDNDENNSLSDNNQLNTNTLQAENETMSNGIGGNEATEVNETDQDVSYIKNNASFIKPVSGTVTSGFGTRTPTDIVTANHSGVDIGANIGSDIVAAMEGTVTLISSDGDYGNHIEISNGEIMTLYAHCSKIVVNQGDHIVQGQKIAEVGSTGRSTGPHLHFEIRKSNKAVNPQEILDL